jgi:uncharacterized protein (DUF2384 family)
LANPHWTFVAAWCGRVPLELLNTSLGAGLVEEELKRMQHGFLA